jgi:hypothetical protein
MSGTALARNLLAAAGLDRIRGPASDFAVLLGNFSVADLVAKADFAKVSLSAASAKDMTHRAKRRGIAVARRWLDQLDSYTAFCLFSRRSSPMPMVGDSTFSVPGARAGCD